jgi:hypothetical protein
MELDAAAGMRAGLVAADNRKLFNLLIVPLWIPDRSLLLSLLLLLLSLISLDCNIDQVLHMGSSF